MLPAWTHSRPQDSFVWERRKTEFQIWRTGRVKARILLDGASKVCSSRLMNVLVWCTDAITIWLAADFMCGRSFCWVRMPTILSFFGICGTISSRNEFLGYGNPTWGTRVINCQCQRPEYRVLCSRLLLAGVNTWNIERSPGSDPEADVNDLQMWAAEHYVSWMKIIVYDTELRRFVCSIHWRSLVTTPGWRAPRTLEGPSFGYLHYGV